MKQNDCILLLLKPMQPSKVNVNILGNIARFLLPILFIYSGCFAIATIKISKTVVARHIKLKVLCFYADEI